jgi:hypothetical protein
MTPTEFVNFLQQDPLAVEFEDVIALIDSFYIYTPTRFTNGVGPDPIVNEAGENEGSCKVFAFAKQQGLTEAQTLACFGRCDHVLPNPDGDDHPNIRRFIADGWQGIRFDGEPLMLR